MRAKLDASLAGIGKRIKEIRGRRFQEPFLAELLARTGHRISQSSFSRMENGKEAITAEDIVALAVLDPKGRGREWLAFGVYEARRERATSAPIEYEVSPESRPLRVAEQGRTDPASDAPAAVHIRPIHLKPKRRA